MPMNGPFSGKVAVVVGSATGIGAATAKGLAARGAHVLLADIDEAGAERQAARIRDGGGDAAAIACDVAEESQVAGAIARAVELWNGLDILHNNAAAMPLVRSDGLIEDADAGHWDQTMRVNLRGQLFGCKHAVAAMTRRGGGSIVNTASMSGLLGDLTASAYGVAKAGVVQLTRTVATQYGRHGIRCNAVVPGLVQVDRAPGTGMAPEKRARLLSHQALDLAADADAVADVVAFLAGPESRFITGQAIVADGGLSIHMPSFADLLREDR